MIDARAAAAVDLLPWTAADALAGAAARFERIVCARPEAVAVKNGAQAVSYAELNRGANRIAHALLARLGDWNVPVASLLGERVRVIEALVGVLKAGKIHTPLDPELPGLRLRLILADADPPLVLVDAAHRALAAQLGLPAERLLDLETLEVGLPAHNPGLSIAPDSFAYILYTSGSTGRPKGVAHSQRVVMGRVVRWQVSWGLYFGVRMLLMSSPGHTSAVASIVTALLTGATLCPFLLAEEGLANLRDYLLRERVGRLAGTASTFRHFMATLQPADRFPDIEYVAFHGEAVLRKDFELFQQHFGPNALLRAGLGSTEAAILTELFLNPRSVVTERILPAGYPVVAGEVYVVDEAGNRVGPGVAGEVVVQSDQLAEYWGNPELNARTFMPDPQGSNQKIFRTGDLGMMRADGMLEHHGRKDFQVKVRGNRVELGEVEMALFELGGIREAVVVAQPDAAGETRLIAYVVPERRKDEGGRMKAEQSQSAPRTAIGETGGLVSAGGAAPAPRTAIGETGGLVSAGALRRQLAARLPAYMVPAAFVLLEALPLTPSGKIDRAQLPAPDLQRAAGGAVSDALEAQLAQIWEALLHVPDVETHEDFFDLGGNSLLAMRLFADIQQTLGRTLPLSILFEAGTIAELAALIRADGAALAPRTGASDTGSLVPAGGTAPATRTAPPVVRRGRSGETGSLAPAGEACLVPIQPRGARPPFFLAAGGAGGDAELLVYARLAHYLSPDQPFYGLRARSVRPQAGPNGAVEAIAAGHLAEIRALQPSGPYLLGGECIGGVVAVEMARQLRAQGEEVSLLCLLDTAPPALWVQLRAQRKWAATRWRRTKRRISVAVRNATRIARRRPLLADPPTPPPNIRYAVATMRYQPRPSAERVTLLVSEEYHRADATLGWQPFAGGGIEIHLLPGTHETYIRENVQATGECLRDCLERAQSRQD